MSLSDRYSCQKHGKDIVTGCVACEVYSDIQTLEAELQQALDCCKRVGELEQELALMKAVRPSQQEIDEKDSYIASMIEGAESLLIENRRLKGSLDYANNRIESYTKKALEADND